MKYSSQYHFYTRIAISLLFFALGFFMLQRSVSTTAQVSPADAIEITGWAWNEKVGWISLNCKNDFDGDGDLEDTCASSGVGVDYGLEVVNINLGPTSTPHIQGCAWAGNTNELNALNPQLTPTAGWLCFSDPGLANTNAPTNGVPIIQSDWQEQAWTCKLNTGWCTNDFSDGLPTTTPACTHFGTCQAYHPVSPPTSPYWCDLPILRGVCYNYDDAYDFRYPPLLSGEAKEDLVGNYDPFAVNPPENWRYCYIDSNCANHVTEGEECIYPQVNGNGACTDDGVNYSGQNCTYDDDCLNPGEYCEIEVDFDFSSETDCTADHNSCPTGYSCVAQPEEYYIAYPNALIYASSTIQASWLTIANSSTLEGEDLVGFPIVNQLYNNALVLTPGYDPDNPDDETRGSLSDQNPINGCFNCYPEEVKRCTISNYICTGDLLTDECNKCNTATGRCRNNNARSCNDDTDCENVCNETIGKCSLVDQDCANDTECLPISECTVRKITNKCDNCLEYFYYKDETVKRCDNNDQVLACDDDADCRVNDICDTHTAGLQGRCINNPTITCDDADFDGDGSDFDRDCQGFCVDYQTNWRCSDYDYFYCREGNDVDCITPDRCNLQSCQSDTSICSFDAQCPSNYGCSVNRYCDYNPDYSVCDSNDDCNNNVCQANNKCSVTGADCSAQPCASVNFQCPGAPGYCSGGSCADDGDCASDYFCRPRSCANDPTQGCTANIDCLDSATDYGNCVEKTVGTLEKVLAGYQCHGDLAENGYDDPGCTIQNIENSCTLNAYNRNINSCGSCDYFFKTSGVILDNHHNRLDGAGGEMANLCGWGINATNDIYNNVFGIGWINFSPAITTSSNPYFSVEQGNIYGQKNILSRYNPPFRRYNASYLIESGGSINNLISSSTLSEVFQGELDYRPSLDFLRDSGNIGKYKNVLGTLDYKGLITSVSAGGDPVNKFGSEIVELSAGELDDLETKLSDEALDNKVFHINESLTIDKNIVFRAGTSNVGNITSGAGIIIVEGDLSIIGTNSEARTISYQTGATIGYLKNIPSVVWIVKGDVILNSYVTELAGTFVVLGDGNSCLTPQAHCGQFKTGGISRSSDAQLKILGSVLAKRFYLERLFVDTNPASPTYQEPAEKFINDGRLQANPPLGLDDFSKAVPRFSY